MAKAATILSTQVRRFIVRHPWLTALLLVALATALGGAFAGNRQIVINTSGSVAPGLYLKVNEPVRVGCLIDFRLPRGGADAYVRERTGKNPSAWFILKPVVAGPGDEVDATGLRVLVNGRPIGPSAPRADGAGRLLPVWRERRTLGANEWFVYSTRIAHSFDSRCFGPISAQNIASVRSPVLCW